MAASATSKASMDPLRFTPYTSPNGPFPYAFPHPSALTLYPSAIDAVQGLSSPSFSARIQPLCIPVLGNSAARGAFVRPDAPLRNMRV